MHDKKSSLKLIAAISFLQEAPTVSVPSRDLTFFTNSVFKPYEQRDIDRFTKAMAFGIVSPILINASRLVIDGEGRVKAAAVLNVPEVPCKILEEELSEIETVQLRMLLNPSQQPLPWARQMCLGFQLASISNVRTKQAKKTLGLRSRSDLELERLRLRSDVTLTEIALEAVNCIRGIEALERISKDEKLPQHLQNAREQFKAAIKSICSG